MKHWSNTLIEMNACSDAIEWSQTQRSLAVAWDKCERGDWMFWLLARCPHDHRLLVRAAALCAETAIQHVDNEDTADVCRYVVQTCVTWSCGEASDSDIR